jgi:hypothetical protein
LYIGSFVLDCYFFGGDRMSISLGRCVFATAIFCVVLADQQLQAAVENPLPFRTVALSQQPAPGLAASILIDSFDEPTINDLGQVAIRAFVSGTGVTNSNNEGLWFEQSNVLRFAAREQMSAPSPSSGQLFYAFEKPFVLADGQIAFRGYTNSSFTVSSAWGTSSAGLREINGIGFAVPDANGNPLANYTWTTLYIAAAHSSNAMLLSGIIKHSNGSSTSGFWLVKDNKTRFVVRADQQAPGAQAGVGFQMFGEPVMNRLGQFTFQAELFNPGFGNDLGSGIWTNRSGTLQVLAQTGAPAAEFGSGVNYSISRHNTGINDSGQIAFHTFLTGDSVADSNNQGLIFDDAGARRVIVREGQFAPGGGSTDEFERFDLGKLALNDKGQVAFSAFARGSNVNTTTRTGIWIEDSPGQLRAIARGGALAPGGDRFRIDREQPFALNDFGQVAFASSLLENKGSGIWATDRDGILKLIVRTGTQIEVKPGDFRTVSSISFLHQLFSDSGTGLQDGLMTAFNNRGEIAFQASFADGTSGVFVSSAVAVPEPASLLIGILTVAPICFTRRRPNQRCASPVFRSLLNVGAFGNNYIPNIVYTAGVFSENFEFERRPG